MRTTLVLDQGYQPHRIVSWQRAIHMLFDGKVEIVEEYDEEIRSVSITFKFEISHSTGSPFGKNFSETT